MADVLVRDSSDSALAAQAVMEKRKGPFSNPKGLSTLNGKHPDNHVNGN